MDLGNQIEKSVAAAEPSLGPPPAKKTCSSSVWKHFTVSAADKTKVICNVCKSQISRGRDIKHLSTSAMHNHMHLKHPLPVLSANPPTSTNSSSQPCSAPASQFQSPILAAFNAKQAYPPNHPTAKHTNSNTNTNTNTFPPSTNTNTDTNTGCFAHPYSLYFLTDSCLVLCSTSVWLVSRLVA